MTKKPSLVSLYSGAGGLDLGLEAAGFRTRLCVESDEDARQTLRQNRPQWRLSQPGDAVTLSPIDALKQGRLAPGDADLLAGGPPCQPFSKSGYWLNGDGLRLADPRAVTIARFLDFAEALLPKVVLLENVKGLAYNGKDEALELIHRRLAKINKRHGVSYQASVIHLNAADFGVPQLRERVFVLASRDGNGFAAPAPTHGPLASPALGVGKPYRTAWDAIGDLDEDDWPQRLNPNGKWADLLPSIPEGANYLWHTERGGGEPLFGWRTRYWTFLLKLAKDRPSWTIQAAPGPSTGPFHWRSRHLSIQELCRLQTIPDTYRIAGSYRSQRRQIGNAVPPLVSEILGREIRRQLLGQRVTRRTKLDCPPRAERPAPERTSSVPQKYLALRGRHDPHPGPGMGPGAIKRSTEITLENGIESDMST